MFNFYCLNRYLFHPQAFYHLIANYYFFVYTILESHRFIFNFYWILVKSLAYFAIYATFIIIRQQV